MLLTSKLTRAFSVLYERQTFVRSALQHLLDKRAVGEVLDSGWAGVQ